MSSIDRQLELRIGSGRDVRQFLSMPHAGNARALQGFAFSGVSVPTTLRAIEHVVIIVGCP